MLMDENAKVGIDGILAVCNRIETDMANDRSKIDNLIVAVQDIKNRMDSLLDRVPRVETKLTDASYEGTLPMKETAEDLKKSVDKLNVTMSTKKIVRVANEPESIWNKFLKIREKRGGKK